MIIIIKTIKINKIKFKIVKKVKDFLLQEIIQENLR